jgi:hypothetical protein
MTENERLIRVEIQLESLLDQLTEIRTALKELGWSSEVQVEDKYWINDHDPYGIFEDDIVAADNRRLD